MPFYIDVIVPLALDQRFTYSITDDERLLLDLGMRVAVPFGKRKVYTSIVAKIHEKPPLRYEAKPVEELLDKTPTVTAYQLKLWKWMADYYLCTEGEILRSALPSALLIESETVIEPHPDFDLKAIDEAEHLNDSEYLILQALQKQSLLKISEIILILDKKTIFPVINAMAEKGMILINQELNRQYKPKLQKYIKLNDHFASETELPGLLESLERAKKQKQALLKLFSLRAQTQQPISAKKLKEEAGVSEAVVKALVDKSIFEEYYVKKDRIEYQGEASSPEIYLNEYQEKALEDIEKGFEKLPVCLLQGVTSSGKTEVYIKLIEKTIQQGKQVLYLLPEIALTTQLIQRLQDYFGDEVLVYHSKYSVNERVEVYRHILDDSKGKIVIGARSSIFLPFQNLGLLVIDESHESSFKQFDPAPRYHARDTAIVLASFFQAKTLLGTATPSLESFYNVKQDKYAFAQLSRRFGNVVPPKVELVDLKDQQRKQKMTGHFSETLIKAIEATLKEGQQVILFQNRRGYSPILECNTCGHAPQCPNCDVSLTYHKHNNTLRCHYCGYHIAMQTKCMACGSADVTTKGFGTEQIETELNSLFEDKVIKRMDLDTTRGKFAYEKIISAFENREIDILVGTQMLTKGLDFRHVKLVGVMNADSLLNFPDFRAHERSFQLLVQVAGRAGRTAEQGQVLIQTYNPYHRILQQVTTNSYNEMFKEQLDERRHFKYPPLFRMIKITFKSRDLNKLNEASDWLALYYRQIFTTNVLGPEFPGISRIRNEYHKNILIKIPQEQSLTKTKSHVKKGVDKFKSIAQFRSIKVITNVDPY
ncbi:replication restart helicase PriA [Psychroflexus sediminis]|uniref:Replication restart protein PriA n=1 Tax=Psychroflexus sediminis TaxID=470826 RepID=A0A1G7V542_9FLAO|nr:primosomal protein N' [Psychroflexus sediminis]SDG54489.1 replication restart DNA helicase PriA [Psychroflexus sediminis]